jgi:hypothetical protein
MVLLQKASNHQMGRLSKKSQRQLQQHGNWRGFAKSSSLSPLSNPTALRVRRMFKTAVVLLSLLWASLLLVSWSGGEQGQQLTQTAIAAQPDL